MHPKCPPFFCRFSARTWCKFSYFTNSELTLGVKFIFIISLMHTLSDKVRFVQRKLKPEEAFRTKKWMVLAEHLLAQAHIWNIESDSHHGLWQPSDLSGSAYTKVTVTLNIQLTSCTCSAKSKTMVFGLNRHNVRDAKCIQSTVCWGGLVRLVGKARILQTWVWGRLLVRECLCYLLVLLY